MWVARRTLGAPLRPPGPTGYPHVLCKWQIRFGNMLSGKMRVISQKNDAIYIISRKWGKILCVKDHTGVMYVVYELFLALKDELLCVFLARKVDI